MTNRFQNPMKTLFATPLLYAALLCVWTASSHATQTWLTLRAGSALRLKYGFTTQTLGTSFGTNLMTLPFYGTTSFDFYSPSLSADVPLFTSDKGGGVIYMRNTGTTGANDFSVSGRMEFFDHDPGTGTETLIVDSATSSAKNVNHGQTVNWAIPNAALPANTVVPAGHMIHIRMTIGLISGNPGSWGQVLYNGPAGPSTSGLLPQNRSQALSWTFDTSALIGSPPAIIGSHCQPDGCVTLTSAGIAGASYSVQATTSLVTPVWTTLATNVADINGLFSFIDHDATNYACRFYRLATP
jgi:hypothetical protein